MSNLFQYISGKDLMNRWGADLAKMRQLCSVKIQAYREIQHEPLGPGRSPDCYDGFAPGFIGPESDRNWSPPQSFYRSFYKMPQEERERYPKAPYISLETYSPHSEKDMHVVVFLLEIIEQFEQDHPEIINQPVASKEPKEFKKSGNLDLYKRKSKQAMKAVGAVVQWQMSQDYKLTKNALKEFMIEILMR